MLPRIVVVGLGPGNPGLLTREAWALLEKTPILYLRTERHPVVPYLPVHLEVRAFDGCYEGEQSFDRVYEEIVRQLEEADPPTVYGVPGHPLVAEATTRLLLRRLGREQVGIVAGLSFLEPTCTALDLDPLEQGLQLYDALDLVATDSPFVPTAPLDPTRPLLVAQLHNRLVAADVKLTLLERYPDDHPVKVVRAAGIPEQEQLWQGPLHDLDREGLLDHLCTLYVPPLDRLQALREGATLEWVCARLRAPEGCPWDREQDHASLRNNLLEESYEALEAIDEGDLERLREELGDLLLQIYLHAQLAREEGVFDLADIVEGITAKLIRRHPHVFGKVHVSGTSEVCQNWEAIKSAERARQGKKGASLLDGVPKELPALAYAQAIVRRAARVDFDWDAVGEVWDKVEEEMAELRRATTATERAEELGDLLFAVVNLARWLDVEAEDALRATNAKFRLRFAQMEREAARRGVLLQEMGTLEKDALWEEAKERGRQEKPARRDG